jgi:hypothetical protein
MPAAVAIPAAISAGSSIFGGIMGSRASKQAGNTQQQMAQQQAAEFQRMLQQYNPAIGTAAEQARGDVLGAAQTAGANLTGVAETGAQGITGAAGQANEYLQPYLGLGGQAATSLGEMMAPGGQLNRDFTFEDMQKLDPGYQFRIDQANKALAGSAAARGGALGGGALRAAANLSQNMASSEYGQAFDRFRSQQGDRFNRFSNLMDMGVRTAGQAGGNLMTGAQQAAALRTGAAQTAGGWNVGANEYGGNALQQAAQMQAQNAINSQRSIADLMTGGAAAKAAGTMGSANAWSGALQGVGNAATEVGRYYREQDMMEQMNQGGGGFTPYGAASKTYYPQPSPYMPNSPMAWPAPPGYSDIYGGGGGTVPPFPQNPSAYRTPGYLGSRGRK